MSVVSSLGMKRCLGWHSRFFIRCCSSEWIREQRVRFPSGSDLKDCLKCRRPGFNPWVGKIPWRRHDNPLQYSCLENPMDRQSLAHQVCRVAESQTWLWFLNLAQWSGLLTLASWLWVRRKMKFSCSDLRYIEKWRICYNGYRKDEWFYFKGNRKMRQFLDCHGFKVAPVIWHSSQSAGVYIIAPKWWLWQLKIPAWKTFNFFMKHKAIS